MGSTDRMYDDESGTPSHIQELQDVTADRDDLKAQLATADSENDAKDERIADLETTIVYLKSCQECDRDRAMRLLNDMQSFTVTLIERINRRA